MARVRAAHTNKRVLELHKTTHVVTLPRKHYRRRSLLALHTLANVQRARYVLHQLLQHDHRLQEWLVAKELPLPGLTYDSESQRSPANVVTGTLVRIAFPVAVAATAVIHH